jgi:hypothetical protein
MHTIQIAVTDSQYAADLARALEQAWSWQVASVEAPDLEQDGVIVLDLVALNRARLPLRHPERIVLIARNDPEELSRAWQAGIISVIFESDSLNTAKLAIMSAAFRVPRSGAGEEGNPMPGEAGEHGFRSGCCRSHSGVIYESESGAGPEKDPRRGGGAA